MNELAEVIGPVAVLSVFALMTKLFLDYRTRKALIEKGLVDEKVRFLYQATERHRALSNLKWGVALIGIGLACVLSYWFPEAFSDEGVLGLMFIFAGAGFLTYYYLAIRKGDQQSS